MKIYVNKKGTGYQIFPEPTLEELDNYIVCEVNNLTELEGKRFVIENEKALLVNNPPEPEHCYFYDFVKSEWMLDEAKKQEYDTVQSKIKKAELIKKIKEEMEPFQVAVELDIATDEEKEKLLELKKQLVIANRL